MNMFLQIITILSDKIFHQALVFYLEVRLHLLLHRRRCYKNTINEALMIALSQTDDERFLSSIQMFRELAYFNL